MMALVVTLLVIGVALFMLGSFIGSRATIGAGAVLGCAAAVLRLVVHVGGG